MNTDRENTLLKTKVATPIYNITPFTLLDYPDKTACILWFAGCNMRCSYCYNPEIVFGKGQYSFQYALDFLSKRINLIDGVVLSGGECTLHPRLSDLLTAIKDMGFKVKIDTNGSRSRVLDELISKKLIDYIALDFKAPQEKFNPVTKSELYDEFISTLHLLTASNIEFEVRTTVHSQLIAQSDLELMADVLQTSGYKGTYYLQYFRNDASTIGNLQDSERNYLHSFALNSPLHIQLRNSG